MSLELAGVAVVPLIVGLVEMAKRLGLDARWSAPLAVGLGLAISLSYWFGGCRLELGGDAPTCISLLDSILIGLALGLSAVGLYSGARTAIESATSG